ncbi:MULTISPECIES: hypothetical protein [Mammaliicoccus]|uniref:VraC protein n=2 Tax=Mammaliicoccus fleurettii TaxID=150056 RepID=A0ABS5MKI7_9STAP|nr:MULTISPECIES: hypothetical protein [Mammaliicoccus]HCN59961.1 VraC protein [Staphylococcus sp.]MBL0847463.1 VraC protein [Mammaliicoccus fleurettii]MBS3671661.1 VraC protein [Mammaliicoccus fleurettii]MBS3696189.1 VraC protein [Mammaliicoccus fleurettii]MBW0764779.1 VraC protein [Mammaliicoccus fleurettii]
MQHYSKDGTEIIDIVFSTEDINAYKLLIQNNDRKETVPVLYLASIWPKFQMFEQFLETEIYLRETSINKYKDLIVDTWYEAVLTKEKRTHVKSYTIYQFSLKIKKEEETYVTINQTFIEK